MNSPPRPFSARPSLPLSLAILACSLAALIGCNPSRPAGAAGGETGERPVRLRVASYCDTNLQILGENLLHLKERIETASGGRILMRLYNPDELVGTMEILDAVSAGKVEAGYAVSGFWMGKLPASPIFSTVPFGPGPSEFLAWLYAGNGMSLYQEMYDRAGFDVKVLVCAMIPPESSGWFRREIKTVADLQGLKMRFFGLGGSVMQKLGVSISMLPAGEIYHSMEKGIIDATEFSMPVIDEMLGFHRLAKYNYFPGWHQQATAYELLVHRKVWEGLTPAQQALIELACRDTIVHGLAIGEARQGAVLRRNAEQRNVHNLTWPPDVMVAFEKAWEEVIAEQCAADPFFKKVWEDFAAFRAEYATWGDVGYLPGAGR